MARTAEIFRRALQRLLPPGLAWSRDPGSNLGRLLLARADGLARVDQRADDLIDEADPRTTFEMLTDWERVCGLPDRCVGSLETMQERRTAVVAVLTAQGGQSRQYFIDLAASLGYTITITEFRPLRAGFRCGDRCNSIDWAHAWQVNSGSTPIIAFRSGQSCSGERLRSWGNERLECAISARNPAHSIVHFAYAGGS